MACYFYDITIIQSDINNAVGNIIEPNGTVSQLNLDEVMDNSFVFDNILYSFIKIIYNPHNTLLNKLVFGDFIKNIRTY